MLCGSPHSTDATVRGGNDPRLSLKSPSLSRDCVERCDLHTAQQRRENREIAHADGARDQGAGVHNAPERAAWHAMSGKHGALILPPQYSARILRATALMSFSFICAISNSCWDSAALTFIVFCTSINYWRRPTLGIRRTIDMICTIFALSYQLFYSSRFASQAAQQVYYIAVACGGTCYLVGRTIFKGNHNVSSSLHVLLHICANIGNCILYDALGLNALRL